MAKMLYITKNGTDPKGKPRVYFTCHPEDFDRYFEKIKADIFATHDCAIYYTEDMTSGFDEADLETDLGQMNLFVVPVTFRLLSQPNRAMDADIAYAKQEHIPILPFMMESGIDEFYSKPEKFGERQYLNPYSHDLTEIRYEEKLKKHLESTLISDEMIKRIQAAFDSYIFLSYRKKDRKHANELMKLIHKNPECRDIAIWYDEFLTPGESFADSIQKALENSKLFALLVTPNLLEEPDGKPNFVMAEEYPAARKAEKPILPAEMVQTDHAALAEKFRNIPDCADPRDEAAFKERLLASIEKIATSANDDDPEHNFLIGLAYLEGIDVEVDRQRGIELITSAAEAELLEAMEKLYGIYAATYDFNRAVEWAEKIAAYDTRQHGKEHPRTLKVLHHIAHNYSLLREFEKSLKLYEELYALQCKVLGKEHRDTLNTLQNMATTYMNLKKYEQAQKLLEDVYAAQCKILGEDHLDTLDSLSCMAHMYDAMGQTKKALALTEKGYALRCQILGEEHPSTASSLLDLAMTYGYGFVGAQEKSLEMFAKVLAIQCKVLGEKHPDTMFTYNNLASFYVYIDEQEKALELFKKLVALQCEVLGEEHLDTLNSLNNLAYTHYHLGDHKSALELYEKIFLLRRKIQGEKHPDTQIALENLFYAWRNVKA